MRLQKYLSRAGVASRREAEELILQGRVRVNGERVTRLGTRVDPAADRIEVDGQEVESRALRWILLHKPPGYITTRDDPEGRATVYSLLDPADRALSYVGRLDRDTEGLLLFTNEGDLLHALLHPSSELPREYRAEVVGRPTRVAVTRLERGVELEDGLARAEQVRILEATGAERGTLSLVLREGRKREVRRLLAAVDHPVLRLVRVRFGPLELGNLTRGSWRELLPEEVEGLRDAVG